jgi:hypothetical protein
MGPVLWLIPASPAAQQAQAATRCREQHADGRDITTRVVRAPRAGPADAARRCSSQPGSDAIAGRGRPIAASRLRWGMLLPAEVTRGAVITGEFRA